MSKLCITLPPFSPDYSGAAAALFDLGGMIIIHDASGCTGNYTGYDEPRWFGSSSAVFCSGLRSMDAILGTDEQFMERILAAAGSLRPSFIALLGSPVPMVIGTDFDGISREVEERSGIPSFGFATTGLQYYGSGIQTAVGEIVCRFADTDLREKRRSINLLGITPIDFADNGNSSDFRILFESAGIPVTAGFCMGLTLDEVRDSSSSALNVVVSQSGVETARLMWRKYHIPFIVQTPIGRASFLVQRVRSILAGSEPPDAGGMYPASVLPSGGGPDVSGEPGKTESSGGILIAGDQVISMSVRSYLRGVGYTKRITVASLFNTTLPFMETGDIAVKNEKQLRDLIQDGQYRLLLSDPVIHQLAGNAAIDCCSLPHPGVSGRLSWETCLRYAGTEIEKKLNRILETSHV